MNTLQEVHYDDYKQRIENAYYLTLVDILMGVPESEILLDINDYIESEMYENCAGIEKALDFARDKTYSEIQREVLLLKDKYE
mgnify:FL=1|tara:strand:+ start:170 stop:418 length:249 start_codon:yes stop_codon:yes gene_type:complete